MNFKQEFKQYMQYVNGSKFLGYSKKRMKYVLKNFRKRKK